MAAFQDVVTAFQRHYYPEIFKENQQGSVDQETIVRLYALINHSKV